MDMLDTQGFSDWADSVDGMKQELMQRGWDARAAEQMVIAQMQYLTAIQQNGRPTP
jgi:hypothetical protein